MDSYFPPEDQAAGEAVLDLHDHTDASAPALPPGLTERILAADALILLSTPDAGGLSMAAVVFGQNDPEHIATHAYIAAHQVEFPNIVARLKGQPTDAQRYQALKEFACLAGTDPERFKVVNEMLQKFEEANMADDPAEQIAEDHDKMADFLMHALLETAPLVVEQIQPAAH